MPKLVSATCNKTKPAGARRVKTAFKESSRRKGYYVKGGSPVVKLKRGKAKGCVRTARPSENKRIRQAHRVAMKAKTSGKKTPRGYVLGPFGLSRKKSAKKSASGKK
jgi:hypothetical protein